MRDQPSEIDLPRLHRFEQHGRDDRCQDFLGGLANWRRSSPCPRSVALRLRPRPTMVHGFSQGLSLWQAARFR